MRDLGIYIGLSVVFLGGLLCGYGVLHAQTRINPDQLKAPRVTVLSCVAVPTPTSSCTGLFYVDVITPAGTELKLMAEPAAAAINPTDWSLVP